MYSFILPKNYPSSRNNDLRVVFVLSLSLNISQEKKFTKICYILARRKLWFSGCLPVASRRPSCPWSRGSRTCRWWRRCCPPRSRATRRSSRRSTPANIPRKQLGANSTDFEYQKWTQFCIIRCFPVPDFNVEKRCNYFVFESCT